MSKSSAQGPRGAREEEGYNEYDGQRYYWKEKPSFVMTVRHALVTGKPLTPEQEAKLPQRGVGPDLLFKYGTKFHAGQRWAPLEEAVLAEKGLSKNLLSYATKFVKGRCRRARRKCFATRS